MMKTNKYFIAFLFSIFAFLILRFPYRDFIYENELSDFFIADTGPNFLVVFIYVFFKKWRYNERFTSLYYIMVAMSGLIVYEVFIQPIVLIQSFDKNDIIATVLGGLSCFWICFIIEGKKLKDEFKIKYST